MKRLTALGLPIATVAVAFFFAASFRTEAATITWTNTSGGNWSVATNWNPNQVPTNTDVVFITTPGTYTVRLDITTDYRFFYPTVTLGAGGGAAGAQTLAMTNVNFYFTNLLVTTGGVFTASGTDVGLPGQTLTVNGGVLNSVSSSFGNTLILTNGGVATSTNSGYEIVTVANGVFNSAADTFSISGFLGDVSALTVANGGILNEFKIAILDSSLTVAAGGVVNGVDYSVAVAVLNGGLTNSGTINFTNAQILVGYGTGTGGIVNQPGGVINLRGAAAIVSSGFVTGDFSYIINQGSISETAGSGSTLNVATFDNTLGTITNLSGTMVLGTYRTNLSGIYYSGAGAIIQFHAVNDGINYVTPGTPFVVSGPGQCQFVSGYLKYLTNSVPNLDLKANVLVLGPAFQGGAITNLALDGILLTNTLPVTGTFAATNSPVYGNFNVASGGVFTESNAFTHGAVTVANGGVLTANGSGAFALTVAANGVLNLVGPFSISSGLSPPLTNSGAINISMTNGTVVIAKGIINQADGQITLSGNGDSIQGAVGTEYFVNQGRVTQNSGPGTTNTINFANLDNSQGSVSNLSGTLVLQTFQTNLSGTFSAGAGATNILSGGTSGTPLVPGTPLVLAGAGQNLFASGYLLLPTAVVPGLLLQGGTLELGAGFQGGAITNLTLGGMTLTNTLPITGTFTAANYNQLYGNFTVANGGVFNDGAVTHGAVTVANGGSISMTRATISAGGSLTLANGVVVNIFAGGPSLYGPLTNAGTINLSNPPTSYLSGISILNDGTANFQGGLVNLATGQINFQTDRTLIANGYGGGHEYLINQGHITRAGDTGLSLLEIPLSTNSGAITVQSGILNVVPMTLLPAGSLNVGLNSATDYGTFTLGTNTVLNGAFNATLNNGYVPTNGTSFIVISYPSASGTFNSMGLPAAVNWQSTYGSTNFSLVAGSELPQFGIVNLSGTNLVFNGTGGTAGSNYVMLASTNLTLPLTNWTALATNTFDGTGQFRYTNNVNPVKPRQFFIFKLP